MNNDEHLEKIKEKYSNPNNRTKNQHFVPQFYLKKFANPSGKIETLDKNMKKIINPQSIKHICSGNFFYGLETGKKDIISQILEEMFNYFENKFAGIYDELVENIYSNSQINKEYIYSLCEFVAISRFRGKYFREALKSSSQDIIKKMLQLKYEYIKNYCHDDNIKNVVTNNDLDDIIMNGKFTIEENNANHIRFITDEKNIQGFANMFFNKKIKIYIANGKRNFVTSDCCVVELMPEKQGPFGVTFLERLHYFVLSPRILIEFSYPNSLNEKQKINRRQINDGDVMYYNFLRGMQGRYLYSCSKDDFNEDEYTKARFDNLERLSELFPSKFKNEVDIKSEIIEISNKTGIESTKIIKTLNEKNQLKSRIKIIVKDVIYKNQNYKNYKQ